MPLLAPFGKDLDLRCELFEISGYRKLKIQSEFYLKLKHVEKAIEAIKNLKSDNIFIIKVLMKKPNDFLGAPPFLVVLYIQSA